MLGIVKIADKAVSDIVHFVIVLCIRHPHKNIIISKWEEYK